MDDGFDVKQFGERLKALRGTRSLEEVAVLSGVPTYVLTRYEKGLTDKPAFQHIIQIAIAYDITPNEMAALADLYVLPGSEEEQLGEVVRSIRKIENTLLSLDEETKHHAIRSINAVIEPLTSRRLRGDLDNVDLTSLPNWFRRSRSE